MAQAAVRLWLVSDQAQVMVLAWDASPLPPEQADPGEDAENGWGLLLVGAISEQWGWYFPGDRAGASARDQHGKVVWAVVRLSTQTAAQQTSERTDLLHNHAALIHGHGYPPVTEASPGRAAGSRQCRSPTSTRPRWPGFSPRASRSVTRCSASPAQAAKR